MIHVQHIHTRHRTGPHSQKLEIGLILQPERISNRCIVKKSQNSEMAGFWGTPLSSLRNCLSQTLPKWCLWGLVWTQFMRDISSFLSQFAQKSLSDDVKGLAYSEKETIVEKACNVLQLSGPMSSCCGAPILIPVEEAGSMNCGLFDCNRSACVRKAARSFPPTQYLSCAGSESTE